MSQHDTQTWQPVHGYRLCSGVAGLVGTLLGLLPAWAWWLGDPLLCQVHPFFPPISLCGALAIVAASLALLALSVAWSRWALAAIVALALAVGNMFLSFFCPAVRVWRATWFGVPQEAFTGQFGPQLAYLALAVALLLLRRPRIARIRLMIAGCFVAGALALALLPIIGLALGFCNTAEGSVVPPPALWEMVGVLVLSIGVLFLCLWRAAENCLALLRFLPLLVACACIVGTLVLWESLRHQERSLVLRQTRLTADEVEQRLTASLDTLLGPLRDLALRWQPGTTTIQVARASAEYYLSQHPGAVAIGWLHPSAQVQWFYSVLPENTLPQRVFGSQEDQHAYLNMLLERREKYCGAYTLGASSYSGWLVAYVPRDNLGGLLVIYWAHTTLEALLPATVVEGYGVVLRESGRVLYARHMEEHSRAAEHGQAFSIRRHGLHLEGIVWPLAATVRQSSAPSSFIVLGVGSMVTVLLALAIYLAQTARERARALEHEIQERRAVEAHLAHERYLLHQLMANVPELIFFQDRDGKFTRISHAGARYFGVSDPAVLVGKSIEELCPSDLAARIRQAEQAVVLSGQPQVGVEETLPGPDGQVRYVLTTRLPLLAPEGTVLGTFGICTDITERKRIEERLRLSQKLEAVGQLASGVAHEFNNMLTVITGYADLLQTHLKNDASASALVGEILRAAQRSSTIARQLLAFSRRQIVQPVLMDLHHAVVNTCKMVQPLLGANIQLEVDLSGGSLPMYADPAEIEQVLLNLLINARDAMPEGGRILVSACRADLDKCSSDGCYELVPGVPARSCVLLAVSDTGVGMDEATQARIFEPFFTTKDVGKGTGLGLAMVYGAVTRYGGSIHVRSAPGQGTTFYLCFPLASDAPPAGPSPPNDLPPAGQETVLVVEDEHAVRHLIAKVLTDAGYRVLLADSADEALRIAGTDPQPVHLLIADILMPGCNGRHIAAQVTALRPAVKVLFISGYAEDELLRRGIETHAVAFLAKPFQPADLLRAVRQTLDAPTDHAEASGGPRMCTSRCPCSTPA